MTIIPLKDTSKMSTRKIPIKQIKKHIPKPIDNRPYIQNDGFDIPGINKNKHKIVKHTIDRDINTDKNKVYYPNTKRNKSTIVTTNTSISTNTIPTYSGEIPPWSDELDNLVDNLYPQDSNITLKTRKIKQSIPPIEDIEEDIPLGKEFTFNNKTYRIYNKLDKPNYSIRYGNRYITGKYEDFNLVSINDTILPDYRINKDGLVYSIKDSKFCKIRIIHNIPMVKVRVKGSILQYIAIATLLYITFIDKNKVLGTFTITYKDNNPNNLSLNNLQSP